MLLMIDGAVQIEQDGVETGQIDGHGASVRQAALNATGFVRGELDGFRMKLTVGFRPRL
jgi:hypothetical protein